MLGEQGGERLHAKFNEQKTTFNSVVRDLDRIKLVAQQHCLTTLPQQLAKVPSVQRQRRREISHRFSTYIVSLSQP